ncbi:MAG TPA: alpha/beta hydrolase [Longimicrobium sp.]|nr:alpha/beta hydrolase [Longimicrobium sp.]
MAQQWTDRFGTVNGVTLHWVEAGQGPLVLLLHGFPEFWYEWRHQIPVLARAGFRVVAPDLRGYNLSDKPRGVRHYRAGVVMDDVAALIGHLGAERAFVVGHDWGGVIAWRLAIQRPELVERLVILNAPHPAVFARELKHPRQLLRSWYAGFFQLPFLPEAAFRANGHALLERVFRTSPVRPNAYTDEDIRQYKDAVSRPGALTAMINYYRAFGIGTLAGGRGGEAPRGDGIVRRPTMVIWGEQDTALNIHNLDGLEAYVPDLRIERIADASHWVPADAPEKVNRLLIGFFRAAAKASAESVARGTGVALDRSA